MLTTDVRRRAEKLFGIRLTDMYGSEEMNGIAIENLSGRMEVLCDNVFLEIKQNEKIVLDGEGESVITNLTNYAMPLIRYEQGDRICIDKGIIEKVNGRMFKIGSDEVYINSLSFKNIIADINNQFFDCIYEFGFDYVPKSCTIVFSIKLKKEMSSWLTAIKECIFERVKNVYSGKVLVTFEEK